MNLHTNLDLTAFGVGLGAVLGISTVSATFFWNFFGLWTGFGSCFGNFCGFSYFFTRFFPAYGLSLRAVLEIFAV